MQTRVPTKGRIDLPGQLRGRLGVGAGDSLDAGAEGERVVLTPRKPRPRRPKIIKDPVTGLPVLSAGPGAPVSTNKKVLKILASEHPPARVR
jgi:bifunctional DNA-binding transcriptional regulator/antitoxin component of YhaV-PrlF toxin-antitoxin module